MSREATPRRHLRNPPLVEVVLSVQFNPLDLNLPEFASMWEVFKERFPRVEEQAPLPPIPESDDRLGALRAQFQILEKPSLPRLWFLNAAGSQLIQVQQDRFSHNWRKLPRGVEYPHYEAIRDAFVDEVQRFEERLLDMGKAKLEVGLCEVTYVDHIAVGPETRHAGALGHLLTFWEHDFRSRRLGEPSDANCALRFPLLREDKVAYGSLIFSVQPASRKDDPEPIFLVQTIARGKPLGAGIDGVVGFFERARTECVELFFEVARPEARSRWGEVEA